DYGRLDVTLGTSLSFNVTNIGGGVNPPPSLLELRSFSLQSSSQASYPVFQTQPQSQTVGVGQNASFSPTVYTSCILAYQWFLNGTNIDSATNKSLTLVNVQSWQAGVYSLSVTGSCGAATSSNATLTVQAP